MKRILSAAIFILLCFSLTSCSAIEALQYSISGEIIDPIDGFSRGEEKGTMVYKDTKYICLQETSGDCRIEVTKEHILFGYTSNFPFFPNSAYYASTDENPDYIMGGNSWTGTFVYLREDLYNKGVVYVLENSSYEFAFESAFVKTDKVNYNKHVEREKYKKIKVVDFYLKGAPDVKAFKRIFLIDEAWYCIETDVAYQLSDELVSQLKEQGKLS